MKKILAHLVITMTLLSQHIPAAYADGQAIQTTIDVFESELISQHASQVKIEFDKMKTAGDIEARLKKHIPGFSLDLKGEKLPAPTMEFAGNKLLLRQGELTASFDLKAGTLTVKGKSISLNKTAEEIFEFAKKTLMPETKVTYNVFSILIPDAHAEPVTIIVILFIAAIAIAGDLISSMFRSNSCSERLSQLESFAIEKHHECLRRRNGEFGISPELSDDLIARLSSKSGLPNVNSCINQLKASSLFRNNVTLFVPGDSGTCVDEERARAICTHNQKLASCSRNIKILRENVNQDDRGTSKDIPGRNQKTGRPATGVESQ